MLHPAEKIGLVGLNGAGKSTLLKVLAKTLRPDTGTVEYKTGFKIGYLAQDVTLVSDRPVLDEVLQGLDLDEEEVASAQAEGKRILMGLGFSAEQMLKPVNQLSVGWKMRVVLAQLLLQNADFYFFDEPTNHLDIFAKEWFLHFLKHAKFGFLLVSHERYFLDEVCAKILELERGKATIYHGNYSTYLKEKAKRRELLLKQYEAQQKDIATKEALINKWKAGTRSAFAKSLQKSLARTERIEVDPELDVVKIKLPQPAQAGRIVLKVIGLQHSFGEKLIFSEVSFDVERGEKVALIAANGVGKSTLLHVVMGKLVRQQGAVEFGLHVERAFFQQDLAQALNPKLSIFESALQSAGMASDLEVRTMLGCFLFSKDDVLKKTAVLSGGEKSRLCMAQVLLQKANFLILDEPTNHLDLPSKAVLLQALQSYAGTMLFVSHDRDFVDSLATHVLELSAQGVVKYQGNYSSYLAQKNAVVDTAPSQSTGLSQASAQAQSGKPGVKFSSKHVQVLEKKIAKLEEEVAALSGKLEHAPYGSPDFTKLCSQIAEKQDLLAGLMHEWEVCALE